MLTFPIPVYKHLRKLFRLNRVYSDFIDQFRAFFKFYEFTLITFLNITTQYKKAPNKGGYKTQRKLTFFRFCIWKVCN